MSAVAVAMIAGCVGLVARRCWLQGPGDEAPLRCRSDGLVEGLVELRGRVRCDRPLRAPLSGRPAVGYWLVIERERGPLAWEPVVRLSAMAPFDLADAGGRVAVRASARAVYADILEQRGDGGPFRPLPPEVEQILHGHGLGTQGVLFGKAFRWREQVLEPDHRVLLRGFARVTAADHATSGSAAPRPGAPEPHLPYRAVPRAWVVGDAHGEPMQLLDRQPRAAARSLGWRAPLPV